MKKNFPKRDRSLTAAPIVASQGLERIEPQTANREKLSKIPPRKKGVPLFTANELMRMAERLLSSPKK